MTSTTSLVRVVMVLLTIGCDIFEDIYITIIKPHIHFILTIIIYSYNNIFIFLIFNDIIALMVQVEYDIHKNIYLQL